MSTTTYAYCPDTLRVTYAPDSSSPDPLPITDQEVAIYTQGFWGWTKLATVTSDHNGNMALPEAVKQLSGSQTFELRFMEKVISYGGVFSFLHADHNELWRHRVEIQDMTDHVAQEVLRCDILSYNKDGMPRLQDPENSDHRYQVMNPWYLLRFGFSILASLVKRIAVTVSGFLFSVADAGAAMKQYSLTDYTIERREADVLEMVFNHLPPKDAIRNDDGTITIPNYFSHCDLDKSPQAPDAEIVLGHDPESERLTIRMIRYRFEADDEWSEVTPADQDEFTYALGLFASSAVLAGQLKSHLGRGHLLVEQMALAFHRHVHVGSALHHIMHGFFQDVHIINRLGESAIFGEGSVLAGTALTPQGAVDGLMGVLGARSDYTEFAPRSLPFDDRDTLAPAFGAIWTAIGEALDGAFVQYEQQIRDEWYQVENLSEDLFRHSVPYKPLNGVLDHTAWVNRSEVSNPEVERENWLGVEKSCPRIVDRDATGPGNPENMRRLKQWCRFSIFHVFWHSVIHNRQIKWSTNFNYASLMMEEQGRPPYHGTSVANALHVLKTAKQFSGFVARTLAQVAEKQPQSFVASLYKRLEAHRDRIEGAGVPIDSIMDSVQV